MTADAIPIIRAGNRILIATDDGGVLDLLHKTLTFFSSRQLRGAAARHALRAGGPMLTYEPHECYLDERTGGISTSYGFLERIQAALTAAGRTSQLTQRPPFARDVFTPEWDRLFAVGDLRHRQDEFLVKILSYDNGCLEYPTGTGKTKMLAFIGLLWPKARIHIATRSVEVLTQRIYPELCGALPSVGIVGGGRKIYGRRIMCYTFGSILHARKEPPPDVLIVDEGQDCGAEKIACDIGSIYTAAPVRMYTISATMNMRLDGKDFRVEALFGPLRAQMDYKEAEAHKMVSPLRVKLRDVVMDLNPCRDLDDPVAKRRHGIWRNDVRNDVIAEDARLYGPDVQTLITVSTLEHAVHLKKRLPEFTMVYDGASMEKMTRGVRRRDSFCAAGLLSADEPVMTLQRRRDLAKAFERGELKKVIVTTVWNVGVSFDALEVLIRADAGGSPINDRQIPGRLSRLHEEKAYGILHDYMDYFDSHGFLRKSRGRVRSYRQNGWTIEEPAKKAKQRALWEDGDNEERCKPPPRRGKPA